MVRRSRSACGPDGIRLAQSRRQAGMTLRSTTPPLGSLISGAPTLTAHYITNLASGISGTSTTLENFETIFPTGPQRRRHHRQFREQSGRGQSRAGQLSFRQRQQRSASDDRILGSPERRNRSERNGKHSRDDRTRLLCLCAGFRPSQLERRTCDGCVSRQHLVRQHPCLADRGPRGCLQQPRDPRCRAWSAVAGAS